MKLTDENYWEKVHINKRLPQIFNDKNWIGYQLKKVIKNYLASSGDFLEAGCAPGQFGAYFGKLGYNVYGFDYSSIGIEQTHLNLKLLGIKGEIKNVDVLDLNGAYEKRSFDFVLSYGLIEHFEDPAKILRNLSELVKPGGILCTVIPNTCLNSLKMFLTEQFNYNKYLYIKSTHKEIDLNHLVNCHDKTLTILEAKKIIGIHVSPLRTNNDKILKKILLYSIRKMQDNIKLILPFLQLDFFSTHYICIAKKVI